MITFQSFNLPKQLNDALDALQFTTPTPIQALAIPQALEGKDILGSAQTGTGKTAAFGIPLINKLLTDDTAAALVLTPTRELALQVMKMLNALLGNTRTNTRINTALLIGGEPIFKQFQQLKARPRLIVATPGRLNDHLIRRTVRLDDVKFLVLDETDRMLDMGFSIQIDEIVSYLAAERQTLLFSATLPNNIIKMADRYMKSPVRIAAGNTTVAAAGIKQEVIRVSEEEKYQKLVSELKQREGAVIVFVKTKHGADRMAEQLRREQFTVDAIHGDLRQRQRESVIRSFRECKYRIMVATDIAARGLDISHVKHVINYDLPQCPEDYIHRIGRTARAGAEGCAVSFVTASERNKWQAIDRMMNPDSYGKSDDNRSPHKKWRGRGGEGQSSGFRRGGEGQQSGFRRSTDGQSTGYRGNSAEGQSPFRRNEGGHPGYRSNTEGQSQFRRNDGAQSGYRGNSSDGQSQSRRTDGGQSGYRGNAEGQSQFRRNDGAQSGYRGNSDGQSQSRRTDGAQSGFRKSSADGQSSFRRNDAPQSGYRGNSDGQSPFRRPEEGQSGFKRSAGTAPQFKRNTEGRPAFKRNDGAQVQFGKSTEGRLQLKPRQEKSEA